jgi:ELWxxDGT repeat protein
MGGGTTIVKDIVQGSGHSISSSWSPIYAWNNKIYFITFPGTTGQELWESDGTESGTVLVKTLPNRFESLPAGTGRLEMLGLNDNLVFTAYNETNGNRDFWATDGTEQGTTLLASQTNGTYFFPKGHTLFQNKAFFSATLSGKGAELCKSDGTVAGTGLASDINIGGSSSSPQRLVTVDSTLFFSANTNSTGVELFKYLSPVSGTTEMMQHRMDLIITPNPVEDILRLHSETTIGNIRIVDASGVTVYAAQVDHNEHNIPALNFRNGVYFVFTESGAKKFVVQK